MKFSIPKNAQKILDIIENAGYRADIVGGCVRDCMLGRVPGDYDITTNAMPEQIKSLFDKTVDTGIRHGTVSVIIDGEAYEVTTYRIDGEYRDNRHPVSVYFTDDIEKDLARRDFTVNAMAYNPKRGIVDPFGGRMDIEKKTVRAVGDAKLRFEEDALRILRAIRFSSVLGFQIEESTAREVRSSAARLENVSRERILVEWLKLLGGGSAYDVVTEYQSVIFVFLPELAKIKMPPRRAFDSLSAEERQILLFACASGAEGFLRAAESLRMSNKMKSFGTSVLRYIGKLENEAQIREFLVLKDDTVALCAINISELLGLAMPGAHKLAESMLEADVPRRINQLAIGGESLYALGLRGEKIGHAITELLFAVARQKVVNEKNALIKYVKEVMQNNKNGI